MASSLTLDNITKRYGDGPAVLDGRSRMFAPGTLTMLIGPNGAGKSTLLRLLSVLSYPTTGTVRYGDLDVHAHPYQYLAHTGIVHADAHLPEHLSAVELLEWILRSRDHWSEDSPNHIDTLLHRLQLDERRHNLIGTYSSGMTQKTQIAAALVAEPDVLLMDEPLRSLDTETTDATIALLERFVDEGGLAVIASHLTDALDALADATMPLGARKTA
ncbi:MAG: ABC transporter ATP-binding protein [Bacteroidetes bacterium SW_9_63_38]|nr:MAG: ABC transporter ATP-binding protein [Bacteroidetes bacterium SW_9_63_38]